jgi:hypothetical protein
VLERGQIIVAHSQLLCFTNNIHVIVIALSKSYFDSLSL